MKKKIIRKINRQKKLVVKKTKFLTRHPLVIPFFVFMGLFLSGMFLLVFVGSSTQGPTDARVVNVYSDGQQRTVTTRAKTVGELIQRLNLAINDEDIVEPSKETIILENDTQVNIYRARPVLIRDGERSITLLTAQRAPRLVAAQAGLKLYPEDEAEFVRVDDVLEVGASEQLSIKRSVEVQLNIYGAIKLFRTTAVDVSELLADENITPLAGESIEPALETKISNGMLISVNKVGVKTQVVTEDINFSVEIGEDPELEAGKSRVEKVGEAGQRAVVYQIEEENGVEKSKKVIQEVVLKNPINEVRLRGIKIVAPVFNSKITISGDKEALMREAGISPSDFGFVDYIVTKESQWSSSAANEYSGAYGLCQSLPASKMSSAGADYLTNPITQLKWCSGYAERYGGWAGAYSAWQAQGWW